MVAGAWYGRAFALAGALGALIPALFMWGFTVDDALIPLRYAHHLATGGGYRFNLHGASTDGVTPLPWVPLLVPLAGGSDLLVGLVRVKILGVLAWVIAATSLGHALAKRAGGERRATVAGAVALSVVALAFPIGAWAASGMETGVATALATLAATFFDKPRRLALLAGVAASLRPELIVWAMAIAGGSSVTHAGGQQSAGDPKALVRATFLALAVTFTPFAICVVVRLAVFGRVGPLALLAKPSDASHGLVYAGAASIVALTPILAFAPFATRSASPLSKTLTIAALAHILVVIAVGGDWMPYARLLVPISPSLALAFVENARVAHVASSAGRALVALVVGAVVAVTAAPGGRHVMEDRKALIANARPLLSSARIVAALDVGWVGAATEAEIVDLAGLTDPAIAALHGGHTSKAVDTAMLLDRGVDTIVIYSQRRVVESRIVRSELFERAYERAGEVALGNRGASYTVFRRR